ncbi:MAG: hypothetical protein AAF471_00065 [Myxococcota bacterium]
MGRALSCKGWWTIPLLWLLLPQLACTKPSEAPAAQEQPAPKGLKWVLAKGRQPAAIAVVVHGLGAPKSMDQVVWQLTQGWQAADVLQVTLAGHEGGPQGPPDEQGKIWLRQLQEACQQAKQRAGNQLELWFLAHSLGVAPWANMLRQENTREPTIRFHRTVWFAPAVSLTHLLESLAHIVDLIWLRNNRNDIEKIDRFFGYIFPKREDKGTIDYRKIFSGDFNEERMKDLGEILNNQKSLKDENQSILQWESIKSVFPADLQADLEPIFTLKPDSQKYQKLGQTTRVGLQNMGAISNAVATSQKDVRLNQFPALLVVDPDDLVVSKVGMAQQKQANEFTNWRLANAPATGHGKVTHMRDQPAIRKMVKEFLGIPKEVSDGQPDKDSSVLSDNEKRTDDKAISMIRDNRGRL